MLGMARTQGHFSPARRRSGSSNSLPNNTSPAPSVVGEADGVVPEANRDEDEGRDDDDIDQIVPPAEGNDDCGLEEEECLDILGEFGVVNEEADNADRNVDEDDDSDVDFRDEDEIPEPLVRSDDEEENPNPAQGGGGDYSDLLSLGKCFATTEDFKLAILQYSLRSRYDVKLYRSEALRIGARCNDKDRNCEWRVYASYDKRKQKMQVKVFYGVHTCVRSGYSNVLKQGAIVKLFRERLMINPKLTKYEMAEEILREYNLVVSEEICSKAKTYLAKQRKQSHECHFAKIWDYQAEVLRSNEGSTFEIETIPGPTIGSKQRFFRLYMCFKAQKDSWKNTCRPIIGFDGAFLKWDVKGHLLAVVGRDGDNKIVPIAWAVVEVESDDNWLWFVRLVSEDLGLEDGGKVAVISDKQSGLVKAIHTILPRAEHRQCARHIMDNWKRDSHDMELQRLFWKIARSYTQGEFSANMDALMKYSPVCYETLLVTTPATWSRAFFRVGSYCGDVLNNLCESFNRTIRAARRKPILDLLEDIRRQCMVMTCSNCLQEGHNKKTCKNQKVGAPPKKPRGRPKKFQVQASQSGASQVQPSQSGASQVQPSQSGIWRAWAYQHGGSQVQAASWRPWDDQVGASQAGASQAGAFLGWRQHV